jgi:ketosteroid isomerase-like protein
MKLLVSVALWLALAGCAGVAVPRPPEADAAAAMAATQAACDALRRRDVAALERLLAPRFTLIGSDASIQTRETLIAEARSGDPAYEVFRNHSMSAQLYGDAAVVHGITSVQGRSGGRSFALELRFTDTLVRSDGRWQLVASHATPLPR